ncbi:MAG: HAD hydrolase family protein [Phycisphaerae bacterium]|jgi:hypothetical protein|nr:HAD hydrolase family protein [Phycisphaerae bacterium]
MSITLCIDFDDTIIGRNNEPLDGVRNALQRFKNKGWEIIISSARLDPVLWGEQLQFRVDDIVRMLREHEIPFDKVVTHKPAADIYIDDKGFRFEGNWDTAERLINQLLGDDSPEPPQAR